MKKFIFRILMFVALALGLMLLIYLYNRSNLDNPVKIRGHILISGDSHVNKGITPEAIPNSVSIAQTAEPLYVTYFKLRKLLQDNKQIDTLILGLGIHSLSAFNDKKLSDAKWSTVQFNRIYPLVSLADLKGLGVEKQKYYQSYIRNLLLFPKKNHTLYLGGYVKGGYFLNAANLDNIIQQHYYYKDKNAGISILEKEYLEKILQLCTANKITPVLVNIPTHKKYQARIPENFVEYFDEVKTELISRNILLLDYAALKLEDSLFMDYDHLNSKGALLLSEMIYEDMHKPR